MESFQKPKGRMSRATKKKHKLSDYDKQRLARLVHENPCLWKHGYPKFRKTSDVAHAWEVISRKLAQPVSACKTAWKALKDGLRYRKSVATQQIIQQLGEGGESDPARKDVVLEVDEEQMRSWKFWNVMQFMVDQIDHGGEDEQQQAEAGIMEEFNRDPLEELGVDSDDEGGLMMDADTIEDRRDQENFKFQLAPLIMSNPCLWQSSDPDYRKSQQTASAWEDISKELGRSVDVCKTAWKSLKDGLRYQKLLVKQQLEAIEKREIDYETIELTPEQLQSWKFFSVMGFMVERRGDNDESKLVDHNNTDRRERKYESSAPPALRDEGRRVGNYQPKHPVVERVEESSCSFDFTDFLDAPEETEKHERITPAFDVPAPSQSRVYSSAAPKHCLVCYTKDNVIKTVTSTSTLSCHIDTIFVLRNLLEVPPKQLESFLETQGSPDRWITLCFRCNELITKAKTVYEMSLEILKKYQALKRSVIQRVKTSPSHEDAHSITDKCRRFVKKRKYATSTDPFVSGDRLAKQLLSAMDGYSQEEYEEPKIKQEIHCDSDNYESYQDEMILPERLLSENEEPLEREECNSDNPEGDQSDEDEWTPSNKSAHRKKTKLILNSRATEKRSSGRKLYIRNMKRRPPPPPSPPSTTTYHAKSMKCPICARAIVKLSKGEVLCEHLEVCLADNAARFAITGFPQLSCPLCENFSRPVENKIEFAEHMAWCKLLKEADLGLREMPKELPLRCRVFQCSICPQRFMKLDGFLRHYLHHKKFIYKCAKCNKRYCAIYNGRGHYISHHPEDINLPQSERFVEDLSVPQIHWWCPVPNCSEKFNTDDERDLHYETCHGLGAIPEKSHKCKLCPKAYLCEEDLRLHEGTLHVSELCLFTCDHCGSSFATKELLRDHRMQKHRLDLFVCDVCGLELSTKATFRTHLQLHQEKKNHQCTLCEESFCNREYLKYHMYRKHTEHTPGKNPLVCPHCNKIYNNRGYLRQHIEIVHEKRFKIHCHMCGQGVQSSSHLKRHLSKTHNVGEYGKYRCIVEGCGKVFNQKGLLGMHVSKHRQEPQFQCSFCEKPFYFKTQLKRHELIHKNAETKPYQCEICSKRFPLRNYLYIHMKSHQNKGERF